MIEEAMVIQEQPSAAPENNQTTSDTDEGVIDGRKGTAVPSGEVLAPEGLVDTPTQVEAPENFLEDLTGDSFTFEDLYPAGSNPVVRVQNGKSTKIAAARSALISENMDVAMETYNGVLTEDVNGSEPLTQKQAVDASSAVSMAKNKEMSSAILTDEFMSDEAKASAMEQINNPNSPLYDQNNLLGQKALEAESNTDTAVSSNQRLNIGDALQAVNKKRLEMQHVRNREVSKLDAGTASAWLDFGVIMSPFLEPFLVDEVYSELKKSIDLGDTDGVFENLSGNQKMAIKKAIQNAPPSDQLVIGQKIADIISGHVGLPIVGNVDVMQAQLLETFLSDEEYGASEAVLDSMIELLDYTIFGGVVLRAGQKVGKGIKALGNTTETLIRDSVRASVGGRNMPGSPAKVVQDTNPQSARDLHKVMANDETEEAANALYGVDRQDALVDDLQAQVKSVDGSVKYKVGDMDMDVSGDAVDLLRTGETERTMAEKTQLRNKYFSMYENVKGMSLRREMTQVGDIAVDYSKKDLPDGIGIDAIYGPAEGGYSNAQDAVDMALWSMRDLGVTADNIELLARSGDKYIPTTIEKATTQEKGIAELQAFGGDGLVQSLQVENNLDYLIRVKSDYRFKDSDVGVWSDISIKNNMFDRIGAAAGVAGEKAAGVFSAIQNYALDPASMIDTTIFKSASTAVARSAAVEKEILETGGAFAKSFSKLPTKRQAVLEGIIKESNAKGIKFTNTQAAAAGLSPDEIVTLSNWKRTWDTIYALENSDAIRSLRNGGYKEFVDSTSDTKLFAKPMKRGNMSGNKVYDPSTGKAKQVTEQELDELYEGGGTVARLRNPVNMGEVDYDMVLVPNTKDSAYMRELSDSSAVLNYREGYYAVSYKDPYFIDKVFKKADGTEYTKAVATAGSAKEAALLQRQLQRQDPDSVYGDPRPDVKGSSQSDSDSWDLAHNTGRSSQRARGERLAGIAEEGGIDPSQSNILGPVDSMLSSARSVANRVSMRKVLETSKSRFSAQFGDLMPVDPITKKPQWPSKIDGIKFRKGTNYDSRRIADARTAWNYVNYLENGYINHVDDFYKGIMNGMAKMAGNYSSKVEKALSYMAATRGPSAFGKNMAFNAYLALNPLRQAVIQSHQAIQLAANFPVQIVTKIPTQVPVLTIMQLTGNVADVPVEMLKLAGLSRVEAKKMFDRFSSSGLVAQIDKQNLVRGGFSHLADTTVSSPMTGKVGGLVSDALGYVRKAGFDAGENVNMMTSWLAHYNRAQNKGLDISNKEVLDNVAAEAINYTYNMNAAGDMRYNVDSLALLFQFLQVPHKAFTQMAFNRVLTGAERGRLAGYNLVMYGVPSVVAYELAPQLFPDNPTLQHGFVFGAESMMLNMALNDQVGTETDFSGLAPTGMYGLYETLTGMATTDISEMIANTPSGKLFVGSSPRFTDAFKTAARAFGLAEDPEETPTTLLMAGKEFTKIASGMSNMFKWSYMLKYGQTMNGLDLTVTEEDAFRTGAFGFPTADESRARALMNKYFKTTKQVKDDVKTFFSEYKKQLVRADITKEDYTWGTRVMGEAFRVWGDDPEVQELVFKEINNLIRRDLQRKDVSLVDMLVKVSGFMTPDQTMAWANSLPESDAYDKQEAINMFKVMKGVE